MKIIKYLKTFCFSFSVLGIVCIPSSFIPFQEQLTSFIFNGIIQFIKPFLFPNFKYDEITSDSSSLYTLVFILTLISLLFSIVIHLTNSKKTDAILKQCASVLIPYYLFIILINYGFEKLVMQQFYEPESNILYTPFGFLDKDILYWSTIGISKSYNFFIGISQIIIATLLLIKRTRLIGLLASITLFVNIVAINFCFDISVKILSVFLLFISGIGLIHYEKILIVFFKKTHSKTTKKNHFLYAFGKSFFILFFIFQVMYPYFSKPEEKNTFTGTYLVTEEFKNDKIVNTFQRFFIHQKGFIIFQNTKDEMKDYELIISENNFIITDYNSKTITIHYSVNNDIITLKYSENNDIYTIIARKINHKNLPVFKNIFHWTIDEIK